MSEGRHGVSGRVKGFGAKVGEGARGGGGEGCMMEGAGSVAVMTKRGGRGGD